MKILYGQIVNVDRENNEVLINLKSNIKDTKYTKTPFGLSFFEHFKQLYVDQPFTIKILRNRGSTLMKITEGKGDYFPEQKTNKNYFHLIGSPIFNHHKANLSA